jgi:hypothetical protein
MIYQRGDHELANVAIMGHLQIIVQDSHAKGEAATP